MSRTQEEINPPQFPVRMDAATFVTAGIDVGKSALDVFVHPVGIRLKTTNDPRGIQSITRALAEHGVGLATLEATGPYHRLAHGILHEAGIPVAVVNPFRSRQFADSLGKLAKTDTIDARSLAHFASLIRPEPSVPPSERQKALRSLNTARRQVLQEIGDLKRQVQTTDHPLAARQLRARIKMAERHKAALEAEVRKVVDADPVLRHKFAILTSIPNVGAITAGILISDLDELGRVNCKQIAALAGVAPMSWDSGAKHGNRMIRGGRQSVRNALYMCAVSCAGRSGPLNTFYRKLIKAGKHPKTALTAVMRKLVILANTLIAENRLWQADYAIDPRQQLST